ncbi:hypothetical protein GCM10009836_34260 [Pseudonocardia ailaonensis]|uniref:PAAR motif-containing protein n=1 Tax=Pseudonocardia ailaonensis TaxID=367279 RepID=A0ABN2N480_9PSEU
MGLKPGDRLRAQNSSCEVIVVKGSDDDSALLCSGIPMQAGEPPAGAAQLAEGDAIALGKRYSADATGVEVLCTKPGIGSLTHGGSALTPKAARTLPSSD